MRSPASDLALTAVPGLAGGRREPRLPESLAAIGRTVVVLARAESKLKYSGSALGYVWTLAKPLGLFGMLYLVFGRLFQLTGGIEHYPVYLLLGIVLWMYVTDGTTLGMKSIVDRATLISKLSFPRLILPVSVTLSATITLAVNLVALGVFVAATQIVPGPSWLLLLPLLLELYVVVLGVGLALSALYVRFRDVGPVWELVLQILFFASPIIYPVTFLPHWFQPIAFLNPFVQVVQDARAIIVPSEASVTASAVYGSSFGHLLPIGVALALLAGGYLLFRREQPYFAERV